MIAFMLQNMHETSISPNLGFKEISKEM